MAFSWSSLREPIVLAPMAGGPSTVALAAAVCNAGGLGFLAAGYRSAETLGADIRALRAATDEPFGVNLFVPGGNAVDARALASFLARIRPDAERYGVALGDARWDDDGWEAKLALVEAERVPVVSFTFGCPSSGVVARLQRSESSVWVTVTHPAEARWAAGAGADALVAQGAEAGGHRGSFVDSPGGNEIALLPLLRQILRSTDRPVIAAGGIADGHAVAAVLAAGARAAAMGTAFLDTPEAGTSPAHRRALRLGRRTALTRAFTGRQARGIANRFLEEHSLRAVAAYPQVHYATAPLRAEARRRDDPELINLWAGQAHALAEALPAAEVVRKVGLERRLALTSALTLWGA